MNQQQYWGILSPIWDMGPNHTVGAPWKRVPIFLYKEKPITIIGRHHHSQVFVNSSMSTEHCSLHWNGRFEDSPVVVKDLSKHGTKINGILLGRGHHAFIRSGDELQFGKANSAFPNFKYVFLSAFNIPVRTELSEKYALGDVVGGGAFGLVKKALCKVTGTEVAVKVIRRERNGKDNGLRDAFIREATILESIQHSNICRYHECFIDGENYSLVMELVKGGNLGGLIDESPAGIIPEELARSILSQTIDAVAFLHSRGIIHRDIKPENILLTVDHQVKVADFGISKVVHDRTIAKSLVGTPAFMAPEIIIRKERSVPYDFKVDSWSIGVMAFLMITGELPFLESDTNHLRYRINTRVLAIGYLDDMNINQQAVKLVKSMLLKNPRERMSVSQARQHKWFCDTLSTSARRLSKEDYLKVVETVAIGSDAAFGIVPGAFPKSHLNSPPPTPERKKILKPMKFSKARSTRHSTRIAMRTGGTGRPRRSPRLDLKAKAKKRPY